MNTMTSTLTKTTTNTKLAVATLFLAGAAAFAIIPQILTKPDLLIKNVKMWQSESGDYNYTFELRNIDQKAAQNFHISLLPMRSDSNFIPVSTNKEITSMGYSQEIIDNANGVLGIRIPMIGGNKAVIIRGIISRDLLSLGMTSFGVRADAKFVIAESNENNNYQSVLVPVPPLVLSPVSAFAPSNLSASLSCTASGTMQVVLKWTDNTTDESVFTIRRGKVPLFNGQLNIIAGTNATSYFDASITSGQTYYYSVEAEKVGSSPYSYISNPISIVIPSTFSCATSTPTAQAKLSVMLASDSPTARLMAAGTTVTLAGFNFLPVASEDIQLNSLFLTQVVTDPVLSSYLDYAEIWFEDQLGVEIAGTRMSPTSTKPYIYFANNAFVLHPSDTSGKKLYLKAKLNPIGLLTNQATSGHRIGYKINSVSDVSAKTLSDAVTIPVAFSSEQPVGASHYVYKAYPVFTKLATGNSSLSNSTEDLFRFKVEAVNGDIALNGFTFDISTTTAKVTAGTLYLSDVTDTNEKVVNETGGTGIYYSNGTVWQTVGHANDWDTTYTADEITVSPGATNARTFVVRGNITAAASGASISTGIVGDSAGVTKRTAANVDAQMYDNFIWSDKSASVHGVATQDWVNGYLVSGLSSTTSTLESVVY